MIEAARVEEGRVLRLHLDHPKGNVLTGALMARLERALVDHRDDPHLRLVLITAAGRDFSFGASVEEHRAAQAGEMLGTFHGLIRTLAAYPIPVAAVVRGRCLGGAFELALACHFVFAEPGAAFGCPEIRLGVFPPVLAAIGPLRLGGALCERMLLTGQTVEASELGGWLTANLTEEEVLGWYRETLAPLSAAGLRHAVRASRRALIRRLDESLPALEQQYLHELMRTHDANEGIEAFIARRPSRWRDA